MRMMDELKPLFLYSADKKVYAPINGKDRKKGSAILLLTPSVENSMDLMKLPYIVNPMLFRSFYIDRNVTAFIDNVPEEIIDFDAKEEQSVSEAMVKAWNNKCKFVFDDRISMMDMRRLKEVYTGSIVNDYAALLGLSMIPEEISIKVYPNVGMLRESYGNRPNKDNIFYYAKPGEIHVVSAFGYDEKYMYGPYHLYLASALATCIMASYNPDLFRLTVMGIAIEISGLFKYVEEHGDIAEYKFGNEIKFANLIHYIRERERGYKTVTRYLQTNNIKLLTKFVLDRAKRRMYDMMMESGLTYAERQRLLPSQFAIPDKRKYPVHDEEHVRLAIQMFNSCDTDEEEMLAKEIINRIKKYGMTDIKVSASNRFRKFYEKSDIYETTRSKKYIKEAATVSIAKDGSENIKPEMDPLYVDVFEIAASLSNEELRRITFGDVYENSPFVIYRYVHTVDEYPAGFIDVYQFPSKPHIVQVVIAVHRDYRDRGIANYMVQRMLSENLALKFNFNVYLWTAHKDNEASKALAIKNGFEFINEVDKYDRLMFVKIIDKSSINKWNEIPQYLKPDTRIEDKVVTENSFATEDMILFTEGDESMYSAKLKKYLYAERIKNSKAVLQYYDNIKSVVPFIDRTYLKLEMYKGLNIFVDLSYYHGMFLRKNTFKLDRAVDFYFDFLNRLIENKEINQFYKKQTVFIPVDAGVWPVQPNSDIWDFKKNLNPISIILRLVRTNPGALRKAWGSRDIIFVSKRGYFKVDFNTFEMKNITRFRNNIRKLMSATEPVVDDVDIDDLKSDKAMSQNGIDSKKAIAMTVVDTLERDVGIKIDDVSSIMNAKPVEGIMDDNSHLKMMSGTLNVEKFGNKNNGVAIITIDPDGPDGFTGLKSGILSRLSNISAYCMPSKKKK